MGIALYNLFFLPNKSLLYAQCATSPVIGNLSVQTRGGKIADHSSIGPRDLLWSAERK